MQKDATLHVNCSLLKDLVSEFKKHGVEASLIKAKLDFGIEWRFGLKLGEEFDKSEWPGVVRAHFKKLPQLVEITCVNGKFCADTYKISGIGNPNCITDVVEWFMKLERKQNGR